MDYDKIKKFLKNQRNRNPRPMMSFSEQMEMLTLSMKELNQSMLSDDAKNIFVQLSTTRLVTLIECYYRDSLDAIFRLCDHTAYLSSLDKIVKTKYSVSEILELEIEGLHFLETIPQQLSFHNLKQIFSVYDNFLDRGFAKEIQEKQYRFKDLPNQIMQVTPDTLASMEQLFSLRHELIHNPRSNHKISADDFLEFLSHVWDFVFCSDQVIMTFMGYHFKGANKNA